MYIHLVMWQLKDEALGMTRPELATEVKRQLDSLPAIIKEIRQYDVGINLGAGRGEGQRMGPMLTLKDRERVLELVQTAKLGGAQIVCGGKMPPPRHWTRHRNASDLDKWRQSSETCSHGWAFGASPEHCSVFDCGSLSKRSITVKRFIVAVIHSRKEVGILSYHVDHHQSCSTCADMASNASDSGAGSAGSALRLWW